MAIPRPFLVASLLVSGFAFAQDLRVLPVPWVATDPSVPHFAYNGRATTFKAIARGGNGSYSVEWDFNGDGTYDSSANVGNRYDLSARFTFPNQTATTTFQARVRVTSNGQTVIASYPVRVFADVPADPAVANDRQLQVMRNVAIDDGLWFLHNQLTRSGNEEDPLTGATITGSVNSAAAPDIFTLLNGAFLEALGRNRHFAAFPAAYLGAMPDPEQNALRWVTDPYAEDALRLVNHLLNQASVVTAVPSSDESNVVGFYPETSATPIPGSDDGIALWIGRSLGDHNTGAAANAVRGFAVANLSGYVAQVGDPNRILGRPFEFIVQQLVDGLVWAQNDTGQVGSWHLTPNAPSAENDLLGEYSGGVLEVVEALWLAERAMGSQGVIVPNFVKARVTLHLQANANACALGGIGGGYFASSDIACNFAISSAHLFTYGWMGANTFSAGDTRLAFPSYNGLTRGQLRTVYDASLTYITNTFATGDGTGDYGWDLGFVRDGSFGRTDGQGDHWSMLHWTRAARASRPERTTFGAHDPARSFARYLVNNQGTNGGWTWSYRPELGQNNDNAVGPEGRVAWSVITLSPDAIPPFAMAQADAQFVPEGLPINFVGSANVAGSATLTWDFGTGDVRTGATVAYAFPDDGVHQVRLTVTTEEGATSTDNLVVVVANEAPVVALGANLTVDEGAPLQLNATLSDPGTADTHTFVWDFGDSQSVTTRLAPPHVYVESGSYTARFTATDDEGVMGADSVTVDVRNVAPVITSTPATTAQEGDVFTYLLQFNDPGALDTQSCSAPTVPAGAELNGCTVSWTPTQAQTRTAIPFQLCVSDDDGGKSCQDFHVTASARGSGAVRAPTLVSPQNGTVVQSLTPDLVFLPDGDSAAGFDWQLGTDESFSTVVAAGDQVSETRVELAAPLIEDARYCWRVRSDDGGATSGWASACFRVSNVNGAPNVPALYNPVGGSVVATANPVFSWSGVLDPEGAPVRYDLEVREGTTVVIALTGISGTATVAPETLRDGGSYSWKVRAVTAADEPASAFSGEGAFTVTLAAVPSAGSGCGTTSGQALWPALLLLLTFFRGRGLRAAG